MKKLLIATVIVTVVGAFTSLPALAAKHTATPTPTSGWTTVVLHDGALD